MASSEQEVAQSIMRLVDSRLSREALTTEWARKRYLEIASFLIGEIEISMNSIKDTGGSDDA